MKRTFLWLPVWLVASACLDRGSLPPKNDDAHDPDTDRMTETDARDTGADVDRPVCTPRELTWREEVVPRIGAIGVTGLAWHPTTGVQTWGGAEFLPLSDITPERWAYGFHRYPWDLPDERWRKLFITEDAPCRIGATGDVSCRVDEPALPDRVTALTNIGYGHCWADLDGVVDCSDADTAARWPGASRVRGELLDIAVLWRVPGATLAVCALDVRGRAWCSGPPEVTRTLRDPARCWLELSLDGDGFCGIDQDGQLICERPNALDAELGPFEPVPDRDDLHHIASRWDGSCGLDAEGRIVCWGHSVRDPMFTDPPSETGFVDIVVSAGAACALRGDGRVVCWGDPNDPLVLDQPDP